MSIRRDVRTSRLEMDCPVVRRLRPWFTNGSYFNYGGGEIQPMEMTLDKWFWKTPLSHVPGNEFEDIIRIYVLGTNDNSFTTLPGA